MADNRDDSTNSKCEPDSAANPQEEWVLHYDDEGRRIESPALEADEPMVFIKPDLPSPEGTSQTYVYAGTPEDESTALGTAPFSGRYHWTGREVEVEEALQYNRVGGGPDPTPGKFLEKNE